MPRTPASNPNSSRKFFGQYCCGSTGLPSYSVTCASWPFCVAAQLPPAEPSADYVQRIFDFCLGATSQPALRSLLDLFSLIMHVDTIGHIKGKLTGLVAVISGTACRDRVELRDESDCKKGSVDPMLELVRKKGRKLVGNQTTKLPKN